MKLNPFWNWQEFKIGEIAAEIGWKPIRFHSKLNKLGKIIKKFGEIRHLIQFNGKIYQNIGQIWHYNWLEFNWIHFESGKSSK